MAQKGSDLYGETFSCSICLNLLKEPVTIRCGHSYCKTCISNFWDKEAVKNSYSCPQCRDVFTPRPVLVKNTMMAEVVEKLDKSRLHDAPVVENYATAEDVACDVCTGRKLKAFKSCLVCLASYCQNHLQPHHESAAFKRHKLVDPSQKLQEKICSRHDEVMKIFCRTDQQFICILCSMDEHKGHNMVSAAAERTEKQRELQESRADVQKNIQDREKDVDLLKHQVKTINISADQTEDHSEKMFTEMISLLQNRRSEMKKLVRSKQQTEVSAVQELQEKMEQEIIDLKKRDAELQQISTTEDHIQFVLSYNSLSALSVSTHSSIILTRPENCFKEVTAAVSELRKHLDKVLMEDWTKVCQTVERMEPVRRAGSLKDLLDFSRPQAAASLPGPKQQPHYQAPSRSVYTRTRAADSILCPKQQPLYQTSGSSFDTMPHAAASLPGPKQQPLYQAPSTILFTRPQAEASIQEIAQQIRYQAPSRSVYTRNRAADSILCPKQQPLYQTSGSSFDTMPQAAASIPGPTQQPLYQAPSSNLYTRPQAAASIPGPTQQPLYQAPSSNLYTRPQAAASIPGPTQQPLYQVPSSSLFTRPWQQ